MGVLFLFHVAFDTFTLSNTCNTKELILNTVVSNWELCELAECFSFLATSCFAQPKDRDTRYLQQEGSDSWRGLTSRSLSGFCLGRDDCSTAGQQHLHSHDSLVPAGTWRETNPGGWGRFPPM